ncbi:MAG: hypothetical protein HKP58_03450 [Desulfatitalea sp.]|nr:hypothetical protein [Desulfatitalea sp.]NNJ99448.1 hypothetical protein [Desulfatitalea sp.]
MEAFTQIVQAISILVAAAIIGSWFLNELQKARSLRKPWYAPYLSPPGVMIIAAILLLPWILLFNKS